MLQAVDIASGQVSGVDDMSSAASSVLNWETDEAGINRPRPGLSAYSTTNAGTSASIGLQRWKTYLVNVTADRYVRVLSDASPTVFSVVSTSTASTQVGGTASRVTFAIGDQYVYMAGGGQIQRWGSLTAAPDTLAASPANVTHVAILGSRIIANDRANPNSWYWSDIGEGAFTSWPSGNTSTADARPDPIVALTENTNELFIWGTETTQVYAVGVDPTLPFDTVATTNLGLAAPYAYTRMESQMAWLDQDTRLVIGDGRSMEPVSDAVQKTFKGLSTISDAWMYREVRGQQQQLVLRFPTERRTFVYDLKGTKWRERAYYSAPFNTADWPVGSYAYWPAYGYHMFGSTSSGLMRLDETSRQDLAGPLVCERTTGWHDFGSGNAKRAGRLRATMRRGIAAQGATPGALEVRVQDDDKPWSSWKPFSVGAPEDYRQYADTFGTSGIFRRRRYGIRFSTTEDISLLKLEDDVDDLGAA